MDNQNTAQNSSVMSDDQALTQAVADSYVEDYVPPKSPFPTPAGMTPDEDTVAPAGMSAPTGLTPVQPPTASAPAPAQSQPAEERISQALEDQNIFHLLGIDHITEAEKESFLDELQALIWEDFVENDVELLLTEEEYAEFKKIAGKPGASEESVQSEMIEYLEKLIPDLEKIMLEKALELKEELMRERLKEMQDHYMEQPEMLAKVKHAIELIDDRQWRAAADELNTLQ